MFNYVPVLATLSFLTFGLPAQDATLESRVAQLQLGKSTLKDVVRMPGDPERLGFGEARQSEFHPV